jgi:hypothetical protein
LRCNYFRDCLASPPSQEPRSITRSPECCRYKVPGCQARSSSSLIQSNIDGRSHGSLPSF